VSVIFDALQKLEHQKAERNSSQSFNFVAKASAGKTSGVRIVWLVLGVCILLALGVYALIRIAENPEVVEKKMSTEHGSVSNLEKRVIVAPKVRIHKVTVESDLPVDLQPAQMQRAKVAITDMDKLPHAVGGVKPHVKAIGSKAVHTKVKAMRTVKLNMFDSQQEVLHLVPQLIQAINLHDAKKVKVMLRRLESIEGIDHLFVLKMKAYWNLRSERYTLASEQYQKLLSQKPGDIESTINLILSEVHLQHKNKAHAYLTELEHRSPNDSRVTALKSQMIGL